jgi:hypothetical protein
MGQNVHWENVIGQVVLGAKCPWGELSVGQNICEANILGKKCPWVEMSVDQYICQAKCAWDEMSVT